MSRAFPPEVDDLVRRESFGPNRRPGDAPARWVKAAVPPVARLTLRRAGLSSNQPANPPVALAEHPCPDSLDRYNAMKDWFPILSFVLFAAAPGQSAQSSPAPGAPTLRQSPRLPSEEISEFYSSEKFAVLRDVSYKGYVMFEAVALPDQTIRIDRVVESYPDHSRDTAAKSLAGLARIAAHTVGSHLPPHIEVYVIFYPSPGRPESALIFAREPPSTRLFQSSAVTMYLSVVNDVRHRLAPNDVDVYVTTPPPRGS